MSVALKNKKSQRTTGSRRRTVVGHDSYSVVNGKLIFRLPVGRSLHRNKVSITEDELKELNLQRLLIKRSRVIPKGSLGRQFQ